MPSLPKRMVFDLPPAIAQLLKARDKLRDHYRTVLAERNSHVSLSFTLDGNLVGDIGEAIAAELFDIRLVETKSTEGFDGYVRNTDKTVQIKATGTGRGPAFRRTQTRADYLLFFDLDFARARGEVVFNGPEHYATVLLPDDFSGQRSLSRKQIRQANDRVPDDERLQPHQL